MGLTRGFSHAGTSQVLASLWPVRDRTVKIEKPGHAAGLSLQLAGDLAQGAMSKLVPPCGSVRLNSRFTPRYVMVTL